MVTLHIEHGITDCRGTTGGRRAQQDYQPVGEGRYITIQLDLDDGLAAERFSTFLEPACDHHLLPHER